MEEYILYDSIYIKLKNGQNSSAVLSQYRKATYGYDSNYMTFWKRQNYRDGNEVSGYQGSNELAKHREFLRQ